MTMSFGLTATLSTSQKLTPQMQQAIKLLQLSSLELEAEVQAKLDSNPLLERIEEGEDSDHVNDNNNDNDDLAKSSLEDWNNQANLPTSPQQNLQNDSSTEGFDSGFENSLESSFEAYETPDFDADFDMSNFSFAGDNFEGDFDGSFSESSFDDNHVGGAPSDFDTLDDYQGSTSSSIQDYVRWQLNFKRLSASDILIADYLIDAMTDEGFIQIDLNELEQRFDIMASFYQWEQNIDSDDIKAVIKIIQSCDPLGVGACDLSECLQLQLNKLDPDTEFIKEAQALLLAKEHLISNNIKALTEASGIQPSDITPALNLLRSLNPAPGLSYQNSQASADFAPKSYDIPDVLVSAAKSNLPNETLGWQVKLNPDTVPKLRINQDYARLVKHGDQSPDNQYLRENLVDARLFIRSIEERNQNLLNVATSIVRRQQAFLQKGATAMQPLILKDIAEELGLHESTVSRLTTSKTILTPQGLFSLKHFFSSHVSSSDGDVSSTAISAIIKQMIQDENPKKPLSDSKIQAKLLADGIDIARRTVAKYREAMNIGSSTQRKQKF